MNYEEHRLEAVDRFKQLDPEITKDLNDLVSLVAEICGTPIALVTLLDRNEQWFKAIAGTNITCTSREVSFCNHTLNQDTILIVPDATSDERYCYNPFVLGEPNIRFYAGIRLTTKDGFHVGSLCVMDFDARALNSHQVNSIVVLSKQVINLLELSWSLKSLEDENQKTRHQKISIEASEIKLRAIFDSSRDNHIFLGKNLDVLAFNQSASDFIYSVYEKELHIGDNIIEYTDNRLFKQFTHAYTLALRGKTIKCEWELFPGTTTSCWKETTFFPVKNNTGEIIGVALNAIDITTRKRHERQIAIQNEALTRIAIIQSHELRRPVASLLGIMNLMKMEQIDFGYFSMMELTVNELDEKIKSIIKDSENTIQSPLLSIVA